MAQDAQKGTVEARTELEAIGSGEAKADRFFALLDQYRDAAYNLGYAQGKRDMLQEVAFSGYVDKEKGE